MNLLLNLSPASCLSVLAYHRVLDESDPLLPGEPSAEEFEARMRWLGDNFNVLPLAEAIRALRDNRLPKRALSITFDDGYADNYRNALPILRRLNLPATFFIASGFLDGGESLTRRGRSVRPAVLPANPRVLTARSRSTSEWHGVPPRRPGA